MTFKPSIYAHVISAWVLLLALIYSVLYSKIILKDPYQTIVLLLLFSMAVGLHGLSHLGLEVAYRYDPLALLTEKLGHIGVNR